MHKISVVVSKMFFSTFYCIHADDMTGNRHWINITVSYGWLKYCRGVCCEWDKEAVSGYGGWKG